MASLKSLPFMALLLLLPLIAMGDLTSYFNETAVCEEVQCGKGTCVASLSYKYNYICQCQSGWKRSSDADDDENLQFLPCVIPNCTLNYGGCQPAPPPAPEKDNPYNISAFDPCYWVYCGEGKCTRNGSFPHIYSCTCNSGFYNLLNYSVYPCYSECTLGSDCASLGIKVSNSTSGSTSTTGSSDSQATSILPGNFHWMIMVLISMALLGRN